MINEFRSYNNKIKLLYLEWGGFGGAVVCLQNLITSLNKEKYYPITILNFDDSKTLKFFDTNGISYQIFAFSSFAMRLKKILRKKNFSSKYIRFFIARIIFISNLLLNIPYIIKLLKIILMNNVKLIHLNNHIQIEAIIAAKLSGIPIVLHARSFPVNSFYNRFFAKYITKFITVSKYLKDGLIDLGVPARKISLIYDDVSINDNSKLHIDLDDNFFAQLNKKTIKIGLFACMVGWKGQEVFIRAADILVKRDGAKNYSFFIVGEPPKIKESYLEQELKYFVQSIGLSDVVFFVGHRENPLSFMNEMDIIVHASVIPEPFGMVIIEAMSLGKPVIATNMGGPLEIIKNKVNGILIPPNDPTILANAISDLLSNKEKMARIGKEAMITVQEKFNSENYRTKINNFFDEICENKVYQ